MRTQTGFGLFLIAPLVLFLTVTFLLPLGHMLFLAIDDREFSLIMPHTTKALASWEHLDRVPDEAYQALGLDLMNARINRLVGVPARRLGYIEADFRAILQDTARALPREVAHQADWRAILLGIDPAWGERDIWLAIAGAKGPITDLHLRTALGLREGENATFYQTVSLRTLMIALTTTGLCLALALPAAHLLATVRRRLAFLLMLALLLPLWTSIIVRSTAWLVVLQKNGLLNQILTALHITDAPLDLIYNRTAVLISLTHVLLPYAVLPIYTAMKNMPPNHMQAAYSLGAHPLRAFFQVYLPQIIPGLSAGALMVFILALGYYITPLLLGGAGDQMLPFYIAYNTLQSLNWGLATALAGLMLAATLALYVLYVRLVGVARIGA